MPQNISTYMPTMIGDNQAGAGAAGMESLDRSSFFIGNTVANLRGLDPAFGSRTLTLIDGRRVPSTSNQADVVDLNIIPSNLLQRMDVVTGGASATYGSGAMAGVVNLVLNTRMQGINLDLDYGVNEAGDGSSPHVSLSGGTSLLGGKGHVLFGLEWQNSAAIRDCAAARDWCAESRTLFSNTGAGQTSTTPSPRCPATKAFPARFEMANVRFGQYAPTGMIASTQVANTSGTWFTNDGRDVYQQAFGFRGGAGGTACMNGDGPQITSDTPLRANSERRHAVPELRVRPQRVHDGLCAGQLLQDRGGKQAAHCQFQPLRAFPEPGPQRHQRRRRGHLVQRRLDSQNGFRAVGRQPVWPGRQFRILPAKSPNLQSAGPAQHPVRRRAAVARRAQRQFFLRVRQSATAPGPGGVGFQSVNPPPVTPPRRTRDQCQRHPVIVRVDIVKVRRHVSSRFPRSRAAQPSLTWPTAAASRGRSGFRWSSRPSPPQFDFNGNAVGKWTRVQPAWHQSAAAVHSADAGAIAGNLYTPL